MVKLKKLRPRCFFDISINNENVGRIIFELFDEVCPKTCENFKALCTGEKGIGKLTGKPLHYKNVAFHRIVKNFIIQSGDFSHGNGKGGESIYGGMFEDETFHFKHQKPFLLSMANRGKNTNGSQFFITLAPAPHLDGVHVVFGHVISGHEIVLKIADQPVDKQSRPTGEILIQNCGELVPQIKPKEKSTKKQHDLKKHSSESDSDSSGSDDSDSSSDSSSSSSSSDKDAKKKEKKNDKNGTQQENTNDADDNDNNNNNNDNQSGIQNEIISLFNPKYSVKINPDEIPEVPKNKFLARAAPEVKTKDQEEKGYGRKFSYTRSGRKIKGRGSVRYRTPSPRDDRYRRSETPPHWRNEQAKLRPYKQIIQGKNSEDESGRKRSSDSRYDHSKDERHYRRYPKWNDHYHHRSFDERRDRSRYRRRSRSHSFDNEKRNEKDDFSDQPGRDAKNDKNREREKRKRHKDHSSSRETPKRESKENDSPRKKFKRFREFKEESLNEVVN